MTRQFLVIALAFGVAASVSLWNFGVIGGGVDHRLDPRGQPKDASDAGREKSGNESATAGSLPIDVF